MICIKTVKRFCNGDITQIENYEKAINDDTQTWDCHHRKEIELKLSVKQLDELGLYLNRPASELIFLTKSEHVRLHQSGKPKSEEHKQILRQKAKEQFSTEEGRKKTSDATKLGMQNSGAGKNVSKALKGHIIVHNYIKGKYILPEELEYYLNLGYVRGRLFRNK